MAIETTSTITSAQRTLANLLNSQRLAIANSLVDTARLIPRFADTIDNLGNDLSEFVDDELVCLVDYLREWLANGDAAFAALYFGEKAKMAYVPDASPQARIFAIKKLVVSDRDILTRYLTEQTIDASVIDLVNDTFQETIELLEKPVEKELRILFIGDCLHLDVMGFLTGMCARHGTLISPHFVTDKNSSKVRLELSRLDTDNFDLVFYSPFTYEFNPQFTQLLNSQHILSSKQKIKNEVDDIFSNISPVIDILASNYSAPVFIHNSSVILRIDYSIKRKLKKILTSPSRKLLRSLIDDKLNILIEKYADKSVFNLNIFDEIKYIEKYGEKYISLYFYKSKLQHPARLGASIAEDYDKICETVAHLKTKKLVVCDLDNTLWDGVIGEGKVSHFAERQQILLSPHFPSEYDIRCPEVEILL